MKRRHFGKAGSAQRGAVALVLGLTLAVLIGFAGLALDLGRFFVNKSELQNAMDACALAAATQLRPGLDNPLALTQAVAYGRVFATGGTGNIEAIKNRINFQSQTVDPDLLQITFAETLDGTYLDSSAASYNTAKYARCTYALSGLPVLFMRVLNPGTTTATVGALATATLAPSSSTCAIPVGVCSGTGTGGTHENNYNMSIGQWLISKSSAPYGTGNFGWIDFSPPAGGASELDPLLTGSGQCELAIGSPVGDSGTKASLFDAWNSRFGWYRPGGPTIDTAKPDKAGYAYSADANWPEGANAYNGTPSTPGAVNFITAQEQNRPYQTDVPVGLPSQNYVPATTEQLAEKGSLYRRLAVAPVVDCAVWDSGPAITTVLDWACVLMLHPIGVPAVKWGTARLEFRGLSTVPGNPCATGGEPGSYGPLVPALVQ